MMSSINLYQSIVVLENLPKICPKGIAANIYVRICVYISSTRTTRQGAFTVEQESSFTYVVHSQSEMTRT